MSNNLLLQKKHPNKIPDIVTIISGSMSSRGISCDLLVNVSFMMTGFEWVTNGTEPFVQNTLYSIYSVFFNLLAETIKYMDVESGIVVVLISTGGQQRAVASAELLARELQTKNISVRVKHEELERWLKF